jgi:hypothetical protein
MGKDRLDAGGQVIAPASGRRSHLTPRLLIRPAPGLTEWQFQKFIKPGIFHVVVEYALQATSGFRRTRVDKGGQFIRMTTMTGAPRLKIQKMVVDPLGI